MTKAVIMDTGPWVALIDRRESRHGGCVEWLRRFQGEIYSSEAVLTEVLYLLNFSQKAQSAAIDFVLSGAITMAPSSFDSLKKVKSLIVKYRDIPLFCPTIPSFQYSIIPFLLFHHSTCLIYIY